jgi:hypothetical protein
MPKKVMYKQCTGPSLQINSYCSSCPHTGSQPLAFAQCRRLRRQGLTICGWMWLMEDRMPTSDSILGTRDPSPKLEVFAYVSR